MNNLTLRDPAIYSFSEDDTPRFTEPCTFSVEFLSGSHSFQPFAEPPVNEHQGTLAAELLSGNHFDALVFVDVQLDGNIGAAFLQGTFFLALPFTTEVDDQGAACTVEFLSGDHFLASIIDPQFGDGSVSDPGTEYVEFLQGTHAEIKLTGPIDPDVSAQAAEFLSGSYDMVLPGTGLEFNELIVRFTAIDNTNVLVVSYSDYDFLSESTFGQPFTDKIPTTYRITSDISGTLTTDLTFQGGAVDQLYALIFNLTIPIDTVIPGGLNRGGATGADADQTNASSEFLDGTYAEIMIINPTVGDVSTSTAEFSEGLHLQILVSLLESDNGTATAEFLSGLHDEIIVVIGTETDSGTIETTFVTGLHELPGGAHPFVDSAMTMDTTAYKADNGKMSADDALASPSADNTLYTTDEEY